MMYNISSSAIRWKIHDYLSDGIQYNVCCIPQRYKRYSQIKKIANFDLENEGQCQGVEKGNLRHSTINVRIHIAYFFADL